MRKRYVPAMLRIGQSRREKASRQALVHRNYREVSGKPSLKISPAEPAVKRIPLALTGSREIFSGREPASG